MPPCTSYRVNSHCARIASRVGAQFRMRATESQRHLPPLTVVSNVLTTWLWSHSSQTPFCNNYLKCSASIKNGFDLLRNCEWANIDSDGCQAQNRRSIPIWIINCIVHWRVRHVHAPLHVEDSRWCNYVHKPDWKIISSLLLRYHFCIMKDCR